METRADTAYPIHPLLEKRWSPRAFSEKPVDEETLLSLLEAARWAPSCFNEQPWHFIIARKEEALEFDRLLDCLVEGNILWAKKAPVLMISVTKTTFAHNRKENRHAFHDIGLAVENMALQGISCGIYIHQMAGFHREKARAIYDIPEGFESVTAIALGYAGDPQELPKELRIKELAARRRKPLADFLFTGLWGKTSSLLIKER